MRIPTDSYIEYALELLPAERELIGEFSSWLPDTTVDCHVHSNLPFSVVEIDDDMYRNMVTTFPHFTIKQYRRFNKLLYPGKTVILPPFTMSYRGIDFRAANKYLLDMAGSDPTVRPVLYGLPDDPTYTIDMLSNPAFVGLKMYMLYFRPAASRISEFFTDEILAHVNLIVGTVILHPPTPVTKSFWDVAETAMRFPNVTFVVAHMGSLTLSSKGVEAVYKELAPITNIVFDTVVIPFSEILRTGLNMFGHNRVLFGTDQPLSLVRANVCINSVSVSSWPLLIPTIGQIQKKNGGTRICPRCYPPALDYNESAPRSDRGLRRNTQSHARHLLQQCPPSIQALRSG